MPGRFRLPQTAISFRDVSLTLADGREILRNITLDIPQGSVVALLGRSGSGKTTLLRTVNGLANPTSGQVEVEGELVHQSNLIQLRRGIGYVIQEAGLFPHMDVSRNVALSAEIRGESSAKLPPDLQSRVDSLLQAVGLDPREVRHRLPWQLSGGQRQRVGVARALLSGPTILLMDEPFGALDPITRKDIQRTVRALQESTCRTCLIVTHDLQEALYLAERVVFLEDGRIVADLPSAAVRESRTPAVLAYVEAASLAQAAEATP